MLEKYREIRFKTLKSAFCREQPLTLYWMGKKMAKLMGDKNADRLPIIVFGD